MFRVLHTFILFYGLIFGFAHLPNPIISKIIESIAHVNFSDLLNAVSFGNGIDDREKVFLLLGYSFANTNIFHRGLLGNVSNFSTLVDDTLGILFIDTFRVFLFHP